MSRFPEPVNASQAAACRDVDARLEAYLDDALGAAEQARVARHTAACPRCGEQLALATEVRAALRALPAPHCPPRVSEAALAHAAADRRRWWRWRPQPAAVWRPALAALAAAAALAVGLRLMPPAPRAAPSAEVAQAEADVKLAFAYLGRIGARTGDAVRHEVIEHRIVDPIARSMARTLGPRPEGS